MTFKYILANLFISLTIIFTGPILVDTCNFSREADRATPIDYEVIQSLEEVGSLDTERDVVYRDILSAKTDISGLTPSDLMIKDLKVVNGVPIAGLPMLVQVCPIPLDSSTVLPSNANWK